MTTLLYTVLSLAGVWIVYEVVRMSRCGYRAVAAGKRTRPVQQTPEKPTGSILVIGDSTAFGTGARDPRNSLVGRLAQNYPHYTIRNEAENAMSIKELLAKLKTLEKERFDHIVIHIGGIDVLNCTSKRSIETSFQEIRALLSEMCTGKIFIVSVNNAGAAPIFHFPLSRFYEVRSRNMSSMFADLCRDYAYVHIPLYRDRADDQLLKNKELLFSEDGIHPNDDGYAVWYEKIRPVFRQYIPEEMTI